MQKIQAAHIEQGGSDYRKVLDDTFRKSTVHVTLEDGSERIAFRYIAKDGRKLSIQAKRILGEEHELRVLKSGAGYYIGTASDEDGPSRATANTTRPPRRPPLRSSTTPSPRE